MSFQRAKKGRACDSCRKRKSRCNGPDLPGGRCAGCITHSVECTYNDPPLPRTVPRHNDQLPPRKVAPKTYVQALEARISNLERLIQHCGPKGSSQLLSPTHTGLPASDSGQEGEVEPSRRFDTLPPRAFSLPQEVDPMASPSEEPDDSDDDFFVPPGLEGDKNLLFGYKHNPWRQTEVWRVDSWDTPDWLVPMVKSPTVQFEFPETSLMLHLVDCYFDNLDIILPLLHRPSFMRSIAEGLHEYDQGFGATVLLVCAIGCRYTKHPGVIHELSTTAPCTCWSLYNQVNRIRKAPYLPHSLQEVQVYPLSVLFLEGYSPLETSWLIIGTGLRVMQNVGVHLKSFSKNRSVEVELWKRAFWVSVVLDRALSTLLGRPCVLQDEDFDADLPATCDEEDLEGAVLDPPDEVKPATRMCCFVAIIKLNQILAFASRTVYSTKRSRTVLGYVGKSWEKHIVAVLDSALNKWIDTVPEQLRWKPGTPKRSRAELVQSAFLWTQFYDTQIHIHRTFALREPPDPELSASSMIICKNASKQCISIIESAKDVMIVPFHLILLIKPVFMSAIFLLLMSWKKKGIDYGSPESRAIDSGMEMVGQTTKRRSASLHLLEIAWVLQETIHHSRADEKANLDHLTKMKFKRFRYVDQDGTLTDEAEMGMASGVSRSNGDVPPSISMDLTWQREIGMQNVGPGSERGPVGDSRPIQQVELLPEDFFTNPSLLFSGSPHAAFTRIGDQCTTEGGCLPYELSRLFFGEGLEFAGNHRDEKPEHIY